MQTPIPPAVAGPLTLYQTQDGSMWAVNPSSGFGLQVVPPGGYAPPAQGGVSTDPTKVAKAGDTMTGTLEIDDPGGTGNMVALVIDKTNNRFVQLVASGIIYINAGGTAANISADSSGNLSIGGGHGLELGSGYPASTVLKIDTTAGDIIATALTGPNAGKSVNLTAGKWA